MIELKQERKYHVSGLKGAACFLIMFSHYIEVYTVAQNFAPSISLIDEINNSPLGLAFNASYWLNMFYVTSGYLVARSYISSISGLIKKSINRMFRFILPIFFAYLFIYLFIYRIWGFHTEDTIELFECYFFQMNFRDTYSFVDVLRSPYDVLFSYRRVLNPPYWCLTTMFYSSVLIYTLKFIYTHMENCSDWIKLSYWIVAFVISAFADVIVAACLIGAVIAVFEDQVHAYKNSSAFYFFVMILPISLYCLPEDLIWCVSFAFVLVCIPKVKFINKIFSSRFLLFLDRISWGIYSFHMPVLSSIGALILIKMGNSYSLDIAYLCTVGTMIVISIIAAVLYLFTFEHISTYSADRIRNLLDKILV